MTLLEHIKSENAKAEAWMKAGSNRWHSMFPECEEFWAKQGITTKEQFEDAMQAEHERSMQKNRY